MNDWASGYVTDITYTAGYYHDQSPNHLNFICLLNCLPPRNLTENFTYCELGCGCGLTTNVLAATNLQGQFYAVDFHPAHIAEALETAKAAGLKNVTFLEASFGDLVDESFTHFPMFDFITLHGIYSWISEADRWAVVKFIRDHLKPGGIVYVSYNSLPGWSIGAPVQRLLHECAKLFIDRSDRRLEMALSLLKEIEEQDSPILSNNEVFERIKDLWQKGKVAYLTHEHMTENWYPQYHADLARQMAKAKLTYVGSANAIDNFPDLNLTKSRRQLLSKIGKPEIRETLRDFFVPQLLRKDVFMRGPRRLKLHHQEQLLRTMGLALILPRRHAKLDLQMPIGKVSVDPSVFSPVLDALKKRSHTIGELLEIAGVNRKHREKAAEISGVLIGTWQAAPTSSQHQSGSRDACKRLNHFMAQRAITEELDEQLPLASPVLGGGIQASGLEMRVYSAVIEGEPQTADKTAAAVWKTLISEGKRLIKEGRLLQEDNENLALLREVIESILEEKVPVWRKLGIL